jgi:hypothetical protein
LPSGSRTMEMRAVVPRVVGGMGEVNIG